MWVLVPGAKIVLYLIKLIMQTFLEGHKGFRRRLFDAGMQTQHPYYIVLIRNEAPFSSDSYCS